MATGSGVGTPIPFETPGSGVYDTYEELTAYENCALPLARYAKLIGYDECAFWGVSYEGQSVQACSQMWNEFERMTISHALAEAQQEIEQVVGYPLCPTWIVGRVSDEPNGNDGWVDSQQYFGRQVTRYSHFIEAGVRATHVIQNGATVNHASDPAVIGPLATDATSTEEIKVYHAGSRRQITPSSVTLAGGQVTVRVPRCRLVASERLGSSEALLYEDENNFVGAVDVVREVNDASIQAVLVRPHCTNTACVGGCLECTATACVLPLHALTGIVRVRPATYADGVWTAGTSCIGYSQVRLYYRAGLRKLSLQAEMALLRLAHAKSPEPPCGCAHTEHLWRKDREVPQLLTAERLNCPFGLEQGAWAAYTWAKTLRQVRMGVL